jgi:hypothetical protein
MNISGEAHLEDEAAMNKKTSFTTDSIGTINAYSAKFDMELEQRGIQFVDDEDEKRPADLGQFKLAISASRESPEPDDQEAKIVRKRILKSINEAATLQGLLPKFLPIFDIYDGDDLYTVPNQQWDKQSSLQMNNAMLPTGLQHPNLIRLSAFSRNPSTIQMPSRCSLGGCPVSMAT